MKEGSIRPSAYVSLGLLSEVGGDAGGQYHPKVPLMVRKIGERDCEGEVQRAIAHCKIHRGNTHGRFRSGASDAKWAFLQDL